jgi:hypothetical protein
MLLLGLVATLAISCDQRVVRKVVKRKPKPHNKEEKEEKGEGGLVEKGNEAVSRVVGEREPAPNLPPCTPEEISRNDPKCRPTLFAVCTPEQQRMGKCASVPRKRRK